VTKFRSILPVVYALAVSFTPAPARGSKVLGWGSNGSGEIAMPEGLTNAAVVSAGLNASLALNTDNTVTTWGATYSGPTQPADLTNVVSISGKAAHDVIVRADGTVAAWGEGYGSKSFVPAGLSNMVAAATGFEHSLVLKADTTVFGWGANDVDAHVVPVGLSNVVDIAGGGYFSVALKGDGTVTAWGDTFFGQLQVPADLTNAVAISAGGYHGLALQDDGTVVAWGDNSVGQLNVPVDLTNVVAIEAGWYHSLALQADGHVVAWGYNFAGQADVPTNLNNVVAVSAGYTHNLAIVSTNEAPVVFQSPLHQTVVAGDSVLFRSDASGSWPLNRQWRFNGTNMVGRTKPVLLLTNVEPSQAGWYSLTASNFWGGATSSNALLTVLPFILTSPTNQTRYVGDTVNISVGLRGVGPFAFQWQFNGTNLLDETNALLALPDVSTNHSGNYSVLVSNLYGAIQSSNAAITILDSAPFALSSPNSTVTWPGATLDFQISAEGTKPLYYQWRFKNAPLAGATNAILTMTGLATNQAGAYSVTVSNALDQFTSGNAILTLVPVAAWGGSYGNVTNLPAFLTNATSVVAGGYSHALALKPNGTVQSWGLLTSVPANVTNVAAIAASSYQSLALRSNGTVVAWGTITTVPANVSNVTAIAAGGYSGGLGCFAVKTNGTLQAWGLGVNGLTNVPAGLNGVVGIAAGKYHALALRGDGTIKTWADNADGGINAVPASVTDAIAIAARDRHSIALKADGTVAAWGYNPYNETNVPGGLSNVVAVAASEENCIALKQDGSITIWGRNNSGQTNIVPGVSNVVEISGGLDHNLVRLGSTNLNLIRQPRSVIGLPRQQVLLSVGVVSRNPFTVQWQFNGTNISAATNAVHRIPVLAKNDQGNYRALLTTSSGTVTSAVAQVTMTGNSVVAWGNNTTAQTNVPSGLNALTGAGGNGHNLALRADGGVAVWGTNSFNVANVPVFTTNVVAIAAGPRHNLALKADGKVSAWGDTSYGKVSVPAGLAGVTAVAAGDNFSLALKGDGSTTQWGLLSSAPANASNLVSIAAGFTHALAAKSDGTPITWGVGAPSIPLTLSNVVALAAGSNFSLALTTNGTVTAWGDNLHGQINVPADLSNVVAIAAGGYAGLALKADGTLATWGRDFAGVTNPPPGLSNVVSIGGGTLHSLAVISSSEAPAIVRQPPPFCTNITGGLLLSIGAVSSQPLTYQWRTNGTPLPGATNWWLYLPAPQTNNSGLYSVVVSNALGIAISANTLVSVPARPPVFLVQPVGQTNVGGAKFTLSSMVDGSLPMTFQWRQNGTNLLNATNASLLLNPLIRAHNGVYSLLASNHHGITTSSNANVRVLVPQQLQSPAFNSDGTMTFSFSDGGMLSTNDAVHFSVEASTNLVDWSSLAAVPLFTNGVLQVSDHAATNHPQQFYRVLEIP
jgi:alpha-tubulin suppressor-like RCC1 family protein